MDYIDKYFMPHKGKAAVLFLLAISIEALPLIYPNDNILHRLFTLAYNLCPVIVSIYIGWLGQRKFHWKWNESITSAFLIGIPWVLVSTLSVGFSIPPTQHISTPISGPLIILVWLIFGIIYAVFSLIVGLIWNGFFALLGHIAAKHVLI